MNLIKRLIYMVGVLIGVSILMFILVRIVPGDPIAAALGPLATKEATKQIRHEMGLDQPIHIQYIIYVKDALNGKLGYSLTERRDVMEIIKEKFPATMELILVSISLAVTLAIPLGILSAIHRNTFIDHISRGIALFGVSFPSFWTGIMVQLIFGLALGLIPITGRTSGIPPVNITGFFLLDSLLSLDFSTFWNCLVHIVSPAVVLSLGPMANITRLIRAEMIDQLSRPYIEASKASGMHGFIIYYKYMLKNALSSTLTMIGFLIPIMVGTAFVVEKVFAFPGIARFGADAIIANDFNGIMGVTLLICFMFVLINLIVDQLYVVLDPRIRIKR